MARRQLILTPICRAILLLSAVQAAPLPHGAEAQTWKSLGPEGALVSVLAVDPFDPATIWAGTTGGLFRSRDGGASWALQSPGMTSPFGILNIRPHVIVADPANPGTVYAGVLADSSFSDGVFKSADRGATWQGLGLFERSVRSLAIAPSDSSTLYAGVDRSVFKSTDGGRTWSEKAAGLDLPHFIFWVVTLAVDPTDPSIVYAGTEPFGTFKSTDGGDTWVSLDAGLPAHLPELGGSASSIAVDPSNPQVVFLSVNNTGLFKSRDAGATWTRLPDGGGAPFYFHADGTIFAGLSRSTDRRTFDPGDRNLPRFFGSSAVAVDPWDSSVVYVGNDQGKGVVKTEDAGQTWTPINHRLHGARITALVRDGSTVFASTSDKVYRSTDSGRSWSPATLVVGGFESLAFALAMAPGDPSTVYAATGQGVFRTTDGGRSWAGPDDDTISSNLIRAVAVDPNDPSVVFAGAQDFVSAGGVYKSTDGGRTWNRHIEGLSDLNVGALAAADSSTIYAGTFGGGGVFKSIDGGVTWSASSAGMPVGAFFFSVRVLAIDPVERRTLYAATIRHGIFKSTDGGRSWFASDRGLTDSQVEGLAIDPSNPSVVYAGTAHHGVFRSTDAGANWRPMNDGLAQRGVTALAIDGEGSHLLAGTDGGSVFGLRTCASGVSLCLGQGRFRVEAEWQDFAGKAGSGRPVPLASADSGLFWFFHPDNWEMLVKVLDGCSINGSYWVFSAATTNVAYTLRVSDLESGLVKEYSNPLGAAAPAITDTAAFAACP